MSIRSEIESKLSQYAASQTPPIPLAIEGLDFTKPTSGPYLEIYFLDTARTSRNLSTGVRASGMFQVNCYSPANGIGMGPVEALRDAIFELYPVVPKMNLVSIEAPLSATKGYIKDGFACIHVTGRYRAEF